MKLKNSLMDRQTVIKYAKKLGYLHYKKKYSFYKIIDELVYDLQTYLAEEHIYEYLYSERILRVIAAFNSIGGLTYPQIVEESKLPNHIVRVVFRDLLEKDVIRYKHGKFFIKYYYPKSRSWSHFMLLNKKGY